MKILNAFSLNMIPRFPADIHVREIPLGEAQRVAAKEFDSAVGYAETAAVFSEQLGATVETRRVTVSLAKGETALVGQYRGPRLPEGATSLPSGATILWFTVTVS